MEAYSVKVRAPDATCAGQTRRSALRAEKATRADTQDRPRQYS